MVNDILHPFLHFPSFLQHCSLYGGQRLISSVFVNHVSPYFSETHCQKTSGTLLFLPPYYWAIRMAMCLAFHGGTRGLTQFFMLEQQVFYQLSYISCPSVYSSIYFLLTYHPLTNHCHPFFSFNSLNEFIVGFHFKTCFQFPSETVSPVFNFISTDTYKPAEMTVV